MKKLFIVLILIITSLSGFSQSVTILPTTTLGGGGGGTSNWTSSGTSTATTDQVGIGLSVNDVVHPLHVRNTNNVSNGIMMEKRGNYIPYIQLLKYSGTVASPTAVTAGILGQLDFMGSTGANSYSAGASIIGKATGTYSQFDKPTQLEFLTTPSNLNTQAITRMVIDKDGRLGLNSGTTTPKGTVEVNYIGSYTPTDPMLNLIGNSSTAAPQPTHVRFGLSNTGNWAVNQEVVPALTPAGSSVNFRYYDNATPSVTSLLFGYTNSTFSVTGAMNATGSSSIGTNFAVGGTSGLTGKVTVGSSTATTAGVEIRSQTSTDANPDLYLKGTNNVLRFGNNVDGTSIIQTTTSANVPNTATLAWKHITNATTPVATPMMTIEGDGDLTVNGFTKLGADATTTTAGVTRSSPAIKTILLTGSMPNAATTIIAVPHGLTASKIIEARVMVTGFTNLVVSDNYTPTISFGSTNYGFLFNTNIDGANINIVRNTSTTSSSNGIVTAGGITASYKIYITYIQ